MGAVVSCVQNLFRTIGNCIMAVVNGIGNILHAIINGVVNFLGILVSFFTCGYCGSRRRARSTTRSSMGRRRMRRSRV